MVSQAPLLLGMSWNMNSPEVTVQATWAQLPLFPAHPLVDRLWSRGAIRSNGQGVGR